MDNPIQNARDAVYELVLEAYKRAISEGIKANSIIINKNMVKVSWFPMATPIGGYIMLPDMICGLNVYWTEDELPPGYSFAITEGPRNRLAEFESIGMEPDELRKAAEMYRKIKEVLE